MKKMKKIGSVCLCMAVLIGLCIRMTTIYAASFGMSASVSSVAPGGSFTISVGGDCIGRVNLSVSNGSLSTSAVWVENGYTSVRVTAGSAGTVTVTATPETGFSDADANTYNPGPRSVSVAIKAPSTGSGGGSSNNSGSSNGGNHYFTPEDDNRSSNANLASLSISNGTLSPAFDANTTEYKVDLAADVTSVEISAVAADSKATVSGTGKHEVKPGENTLSVTVTAENQTTKTYTIKAIVDEKPQVYVEYDGDKLGVVRNLEGIKVPSTFVESTVTIDKKEVKAWKSDTLHLTIIYLINEEKSEKNFYIYDVKEKKVKSIFKPLTLLGRNVFVVDIDKKLQDQEGLQYGKVSVDGNELNGWTFENKDFENYVLLYVMDANGEMQYYLYEKTENTLQLYLQSAPVSSKDYNTLVDKYSSSKTWNIILSVLAGILGIALVCVLYQAHIRNKQK